MPQFRFIGDPKARDGVFCLRYKETAGKPYDPADPRSITMFRTELFDGYEFALNGDPVEVPDKQHAARLRGNRHFEEMGAQQSAAGNGHSAGGAAGQSGASDAGSGNAAPQPPKRGPGRPRKNVE